MLSSRQVQKCTCTCELTLLVFRGGWHDLESSQLWWVLGTRSEPSPGLRQGAAGQAEQLCGRGEKGSAQPGKLVPLLPAFAFRKGVLVKWYQELVVAEVLQK